MSAPWYCVVVLAQDRWLYIGTDPAAAKRHLSPEATSFFAPTRSAALRAARDALALVRPPLPPGGR